MATLRRETSKALTRQRVLETADLLFQQHGFQSTTIRDIAAHAGVSVGTVMIVGDKDALLVAVFDHLIERIHHGRAEGAARSGADGLVELVRPFVELFAQRGALAQRYAGILVAGTHRSSIFEELAEHLLAEFRRTFAGTSVDADPDAHPDADRRARTAYLAYLGVLFSASGRNELDPARILDELRLVFTVIDPRGAA